MALNQLPKYVYYLLIAQAFNLIAAVLSVTVSAIVGLKLAPTQALATVHYGLQFLAMLLTTFVFSFLMKRWGAMLYFSLVYSAYLRLVFGISSLIKTRFLAAVSYTFFAWAFLSTASFYRFAASDRLSSELIPKATALVISGGVVAAVIAPVLAIQFQKVKGLPDFTAIYLIFCGLALLLSPILYIWHSKHKLQQTPQPKVESLNRVKMSKHLVVAAIISGAFAYYIMNVMMIMSSLHLKSITLFITHQFQSSCMFWQCLSHHSLCQS
jgi:hypothetical protein